MVQNREFLTEKACKNIKILDEQELSEDDRNKLKQESEMNRSKGIAIAYVLDWLYLSLLALLHK